MKDIEKLELIKNLTKLEAQLSAIRSPAYGRLYLRADARTTIPELLCQPLDRSIDPSGLFCIGSSCDRSFYDDSGVKNIKAKEFDQGPCEFPELYCCASC